MSRENSCWWDGEWRSLSGPIFSHGCDKYALPVLWKESSCVTQGDCGVVSHMLGEVDYLVGESAVSSIGESWYVLYDPYWWTVGVDGSQGVDKWLRPGVVQGVAVPCCGKGLARDSSAYACRSSHGVPVCHVGDGVSHYRALLVSLEVGGVDLCCLWVVVDCQYTLAP